MIDDLDVVGSPMFPEEAKAPLVVHVDTMLPLSLSNELLESIGRRNPEVGGRFILAGPVELVLIGDGDWDEVVIGEYPSKLEAFRMQTLPGYADINVHRLAGLQNVQTLSFNQHDLDRLTIADAWRNRS